MKDGIISRLLQSVVFVIILVFSVSSNSMAFDFSDWDTLVKKYVAPETVNGVLINAVDYAGLKKDPLFSSLASRLNSYDLVYLKTEKSKLTFWINVYNILAAKMITDHYPIESIKDAGSFLKPVWKQPAGRVAGNELTLHNIEHEILRKMNEPRIHAAIVCASVSCPDLRMEAYTIKRLTEQLDDQMAKFFQSQDKGMKLNEKINRVYLSSIFKWFKEDFESRGGVLKFLSQYTSEEEKKILNNPKLNISYMDYNWEINGH